MPDRDPVDPSAPVCRCSDCARARVEMTLPSRIVLAAYEGGTMARAADGRVDKRDYRDAFAPPDLRGNYDGDLLRAWGDDPIVLCRMALDGDEDARRTLEWIASREDPEEVKDWPEAPRAGAMIDEVNDAA